ncbi:MAG: HNH endonuclease signature motif containing protein, partial [Streptosporangiaceae bacterium]
PGAGPPCDCAGPRGTGPPGGAGQIPWLAGITIKWLETEACGHARETRAYQPSPALRHLIKTRDQTCSFPGCRRPARRCDDDHTQPFDQGGRTCECNLTPLCRRHHAAKQAPGWHLQQPQPGTLTWTFPSGRTRTVTPPPYPA